MYYTMNLLHCQQVAENMAVFPMVFNKKFKNGLDKHTKRMYNYTKNEKEIAVMMKNKFFFYFFYFAKGCPSSFFYKA